MVVEDEKTKELKSTPFHVRFGKMQIIKAAGTEVSIYVNEELSPLRMKLDFTGEGYFMEEGMKPFPFMSEVRLTESEDRKEQREREGIPHRSVSAGVLPMRGKGSEMSFHLKEGAQVDVLTEEELLREGEILMDEGLEGKDLVALYSNIEISLCASLLEKIDENDEKTAKMVSKGVSELVSELVSE